MVTCNLIRSSFLLVLIVVRSTQADWIIRVFEEVMFDGGVIVVHQFLY